MGSGGAPSPAPPPPPARYPLALVYVCLSTIAGLWGASQGLHGWLLCIGLPAAAIGWRRGGWRLTVLILVCVLAMGAGGWRLARAAYHDSPAEVGHYVGHTVQITGVIDGEGQIAGLGENMPVSVEQLIVDGKTVRAQGRVLVHYTGPQSLEYGDRLTLTGDLERPDNPPGFDYRAYLAGQGIHAALSFPGITAVSHGAGNPLQALAYRLREALRKAINGMLPHDLAALLIGILLGAPTRSLGSLTAPFVRAGLIHVVAISGLKVALVAGTAARLSRRLPARVRPFPPLATVGLYTLVSGATPSGLRSALMWGLAVIALSLGRRSDVWVSLALVAAGMLWWNPLLLHDLGFQLSVTGTAGIVVFTPFFEHPLRWMPILFRESTAVTLAAQIATLPLTMAGFGQISLIGPIANGLLLPLLGPIMALGGVVALIAVPVPMLGHLLAYLLYPWLALFAGATQLLASLPFAATPPLPLPAWPVAAYYACLVFLGRRPKASSITRLVDGPLSTLTRRPLRVAGAAALSVSVALAVGRPPTQAVLWVEPMGADQTLLLQTPSGQVVVIDGGENPSALQAVLGARLPFWQRNLTAVLVSQPDAHHMGGLHGLNALYPIGEAFEPGAVYPAVAYARWHAELRNAGVRDRKARTGMRLNLGSGTWIDVLEPAAVNLDDPIAPVGYRIHIGRLSVLVVNAEALEEDPTPLAADGGCLDAVILPATSDPSSAVSIVVNLRPHLVVLPPDGSITSSDLAPLPRGTRLRLSASREFALRSQDGACP
ncbi:MAG: ComEC/Rec2 family competence protein [Chloroflexota bacterium]